MVKQKINRLLIGTNNKGKLREIKSLLPKNIKIHSISEFSLKSPIENGKTFKENSLIKSKYFSKKTGLICLADDSGLEIDFLDKKPGIYSARWGGRQGDFSKAIRKVYRELTKKYEEHIVNNLDGLIDYFNDLEIKGEITMIIKGALKKKIAQQNLISLRTELKDLIDAGLSLSSASKYLAKKENLSKNLIYNLLK